MFFRKNRIFKKFKNSGGNHGFKKSSQNQKIVGLKKKIMNLKKVHKLEKVCGIQKKVHAFEFFSQTQKSYEFKKVFDFKKVHTCENQVHKFE